MERVENMLGRIDVFDAMVDTFVVAGIAAVGKYILPDGALAFIVFVSTVLLFNILWNGVKEK